MLNELGPQGFLDAIQMSNERALSKVSGIGIKKAEQMIVQLKHKVGQLIKSGIEISDAGHLAQWHMVTEALESLNYSRVEINQAMHHLKKEDMSGKQSFDYLLRQALSFLSKHPRQSR